MTPMTDVAMVICMYLSRFSRPLICRLLCPNETRSPTFAPARVNAQVVHLV